MGSPVNHSFGSQVDTLDEGCKWRAHPRIAVPCPCFASGAPTREGQEKTSVTAWFARELRRQGHTVGILGHGYRGSHSRSGLVTGPSDAHWAGDEAALLAHYGFGGGHAASSPRDSDAARQRGDRSGHG